MAKTKSKTKRKRTVNPIIAGKSIKDLLAMDLKEFNRLNRKDLADVVGRLVSAGNKRYRRLVEAGKITPAVEKLRKSGGVLSAKGKNLNELRKEFSRAKSFLQDQTSTKRGYEKVKKETSKKLKKAAEEWRKKGVNISDENVEDFIRAYEMLKEIDQAADYFMIRYEVQAELADKIEAGINIHDAVEQMKERIHDIYEENIWEEEYDKFYEFFAT